MHKLEPLQKMRNIITSKHTVMSKQLLMKPLLCNDDNAHIHALLGNTCKLFNIKLVLMAGKSGYRGNDQVYPDNLFMSR